MKDRWLDEGIRVLAEQGVSAVRVDRIATRLGVTKGSFHHHFRGVADYHRSLLARYRTEALNGIDQAIGAVSRLSPERALTQLPTTFAFDRRLESAVRAWALENPEAGAVQEQVDAARLDALVGLWRQLLPDAASARSAALVPHLLMIGATVARPQPTDAELKGVFSLLARLVPAVG